MTQTTGRFFDELGKLITDAAGAAQGVRKEIESVVRAQAETILRTPWAAPAASVISLPSSSKNLPVVCVMHAPLKTA